MDVFLEDAHTNEGSSRDSMLRMGVMDIPQR
jgi:hypothetical protein